MSGFDVQLSGLAGEIRGLVASELFDLGGYTQDRVNNFVAAAFSKPLDAPKEMISIKFVIGGGKLVRSKYSDDLPKWLIAALREQGYVDDKSAAETFDSQGTFKQQHDTGQNLKYLIVFPNVTCSEKTNTAAETEDQGPLMDISSPSYIVVVSEVSTFKEIVASKVQSYRQKKTLLKTLQDAADSFSQVEKKLVAGVPLTPAEQDEYDRNTGCDAEKIAYLQGEMKSMVENGKLTASEKEEVLKQIESNLVAVEKELADGGGKKEALEKKKQTILARKDLVTKNDPIVIRLKHSDEILKFRVKLYPLQELEDKGRSMSLTLQDLNKLSAKTDIEAAIASLEEGSRGWFETDEDHEAKCKIAEKEAKTLYSKSKGNSGSKKSSGPTGTQNKMAGRGVAARPSGNSWATASKTVKGAGTAFPKTVVNKPSSSGFASAFGDSDSD